MTIDQQGSAETVTATAQVSVGGWVLNARLSVPTAPTPLRTMLPVVQQLADGMISLAVRTVEEEGKQISCKAGCGACCRQLVPITEVEARNIRDLVDGMPEPRRSQVRARFAEARRRLQEAGVLERLEQRGQWSAEEFQTIGLEYFYLGIPCPFLEDESCSIHPERPITCREYLVTSPAENCSHPTAENIDWVGLAVKVWRELALFAKVAPGAQYLRWVPLVLAPEWADTHPEEPELRPGPKWLEELFERIAAKASSGQEAATAPTDPGTGERMKAEG
ncbi:MAG TPA: YkgJ family cysteine cluster protein [Gemmataceae bacterium]|nr:YkgJ family cysteine cluster protein [Gemmataceae bacterium]